MSVKVNRASNGGGGIVSQDIWKPAGRLLQRFLQYTHPECHFKVQVHFEMFAWWLKWRKLCRVTLSKWTSSGDMMFFQRLDNHQCLSAQGPPPGYIQGKNKNNCDVNNRHTKGKREKGVSEVASFLSLFHTKPVRRENNPGYFWAATAYWFPLSASRAGNQKVTVVKWGLPPWKLWAF